MNLFQKTLFDDLEALVKSNDAFYRQEFILDDKKYWIYNYRLASYTDFLARAAKECRGVMFRIKDDVAVHLCSLPFEKFFNLNENPETINLDLSKVSRIELKADGSLCSTYIHNDQLRLKSKGSLFSDQALAAMAWLDKPENYALKDLLVHFASNFYTINLEWTAPDNRVVIGYMEPKLTVLNVRSNIYGHYHNIDTDVWNQYRIPTIDVDDPVSFVAGIPSMQGVEGYVVYLEDDVRVKVKTEWYLVQHRAKDSINSDRRLFEAVLEQTTDDLRSLFHDDQLVIERITMMEMKVDHLYSAMIEEVETYYQANKDLSRKDYAIKGKQEITPLYFGLAMMRYVGKRVDYKDFLKNKWKECGIKDQPKEEVEEN